MQKRIFTVLISKLVFFRLYNFSHFIFYRDTSYTTKFLACIFQHRGWGCYKKTWHFWLAYASQKQESEYVKESQQRSMLLHAPQDTILRVGVLDDNPAILGLIETVLTMDGHIVYKHTSGSSLLNALFPEDAEERSPYDVVILDLLLPGAHSGVDVFFAIRQRFSTETLPIIVITAVDEPTLKQFRHILPDDVPVLRKPFAPRKFRQLIAQLTRKVVRKT